MKRRDVESSLFWAAFGCLFLVEALRQGLWLKGVPGPGFLPFFCGCALILLSLIVMIPAFLKKEGGEKGAEEKDSSEDSVGLKRTLLAIVALVGFAFAIEPLGYLISTFLFMTVAGRLLEAKAWWKTLLLAFLTSALTYVLFVILLGVSLPQGLITFI